MEQLSSALRESKTQKGKGNDANALKDYDDANRKYTSAIGKLKTSLEMQQLPFLLLLQAFIQQKPMHEVLFEVFDELCSLYANRATILARLKIHDKALEDTMQVIQYKPAWFKGYTLQATILFSMSQYEEAFAVMDKAIALSATADEKAKFEERKANMKKLSLTQLASSVHSATAQATSIPIQVAVLSPSKQPSKQSSSTSITLSTTTTEAAAMKLQTKKTLTDSSRDEDNRKENHYQDVQLLDTPYIVQNVSDLVTPVIQKPLADSSQYLNKHTNLPTQQTSSMFTQDPSTKKQSNELLVPTVRSTPSSPQRLTRPVSPSPNTSRLNLTSPSSSSTNVGIHDYSQLPIITLEGLRDLLGDETYTEAIPLYEKKIVHSIRIKHKELYVEKEKEKAREKGITFPTATSHPLVSCSGIEGRVIRKQDAMPAQNTSSENMFYEATVLFEGNKCVFASCNCRDQRWRDHEKKINSSHSSKSDDKIVDLANEQEDDDVNTTTTSSSSSSSSRLQQHISYSPPIPLSYPPCKHVGAMLLVLRRKQEEEEKRKLDKGESAMPPLERLKRSIHIFHRKSKTEIEREARLRQEYESKTSAQLSSLLSKNDLRKSGLKGELISRVVDGIMNGVLPKCPKCTRGRLFYAAGKYHCHGSHDLVYHYHNYCDFTVESVQRKQWTS